MPLLLTYFENASGQISIPPTEDIPTPRGYERRECHTIYEVMKLEARMQQDATCRAEIEAEEDSQRFDARRKQIRRDIQTKIASSNTDPETKEFLRLWCELRDEQRRKKYADFIHQRLCYFEALHYDKPRNAEEVLGEAI